MLIPLEGITSEHGELPMEQRAAVRQAVRDWGFAGINHAKAHGGLGLTMLEQTVIEEQLGRVTNGLWSCVWRPPVSLKFGTAAQIEEYLRPSCQGERRGCFAITEPNAGSDPRRCETTARLENGRWRLDGEKWFVTSYSASDFIIVHAHVDGDPDKPTLFLVDKPAEGLTHLRSPRFMHDFAFDHAELRLEDLGLAPEKMLGGIGQGFELTKDWSYDVLTAGFPGPIVKGQIVQEPVNLGKGWVGFDFTAAFGRPTRLINDAAMQALGSYEGGRMLFLGLGTGLGNTLILDGTVAPLELGHLRYKKGRTFEDYLGLRGLKWMGKKRWRLTVADVVALVLPPQAAPRKESAAAGAESRCSVISLSRRNHRPRDSSRPSRRTPSSWSSGW